jgi:rhodanese-related sulfurtransferase
MGAIGASGLFAVLLLAQTGRESVPIRPITPSEASALVDRGGALLVDVREADEVAGGMALPARWLPKSRLEQHPEKLTELLDSVPQTVQVIFYCASGRRAQAVAETATWQGHSVRNMGGYDGWARAGLPVKRGPGPVRAPGQLDSIVGEILKLENVDGRPESEVRAIVAVGKAQVTVRLGPVSFVLHQGVQLAPQDRVIVEGSTATADGAQGMVAVEILRNNDKLILRDSNGTPLWMPRK